MDPTTYRTNMVCVLPLTPSYKTGNMGCTYISPSDHTMKASLGCRCIALLVLKFVPRRTLLGNITLRPLYVRYPLDTSVGGPKADLDYLEKRKFFCLNRDSKAGLSSHYTLYNMSYNSHYTNEL